MSDRLHNTLTGLRSDVDRAALADSTAVRARGNQRTRRQAIGTSLAVVALVAGVIGVSGALTGTDQSAELPADQTTSAPPTAEPRLVLGPQLLLEADELPPVPAQTFSVAETIESATSADAEERFLNVCGVPPTGGGTPEKALLRTFPSDLDGFMWQWVAQYATVTDAEASVAALSTACTSYGAAPVDIVNTGMPGVQDAFRAGKFSAEPDSEFNGEVAGVVRLGDAVAVVGLRGMLRERDVDFDAFDATVTSAAQRLTIR